MRINYFLTIIICLAVLIFISGCSTISYYGQSIVGHSKIMLARTPIDRAIDQAYHDGNTELSRKLQLAKELREFSEQVLGLPSNDSYRLYVELDRASPVWTVVAAEEFSLEAKAWCYLVIGCASYRGYFHKEDAIAYAVSLEDEGLETTVVGAAAYSSLGWFDDPLLSSMLQGEDVDLAEVLFHELAHQVLYVNGASNFNEAFATVVGEHGAILWLEKNRPKSLQSYLARLSARDDFFELISAAKLELASVYQSAVSDEQMTKEKVRVFNELRANYKRLKDSRWEGKPRYDFWFKTPLNNARLAAFSTYRDRVPEIKNLLDSCGGEFRRFLDIVRNNGADLANGEMIKDCQESL